MLLVLSVLAFNIVHYGLALTRNTLVSMTRRCSFQIHKAGNNFFFGGTCVLGLSRTSSSSDPLHGELLSKRAFGASHTSSAVF